MPVKDLMVVNTSPYIRPIVTLIEDYETLGLIIMDNHRARIYVVSSGRIEDKNKVARDIDQGENPCNSLIGWTSILGGTKRIIQ
jgi:hypothetical protein